MDDTKCRFLGKEGTIEEGRCKHLEREHNTWNLCDERKCPLTKGMEMEEGK